MPWTCPVCRQPIRRGDNEAMPRIGQLYRCHVCRVDLVFDPKPQALIVIERDSGGPR